VMGWKWGYSLRWGIDVGSWGWVASLSAKPRYRSSRAGSLPHWICLAQFPVGASLLAKAL
jgi:hypothetical protein